VGPLNAAELQENAGKAGFGLGRREEMPYEKTFAWVLANARRFRVPVPYEHPSGAVIWVQLDDAVERAVRNAR
jgi:hypothetical protein